ncbi:MAG: transposase, partial [Candidatus Marinimicrobia bacterium]|nr:transposase [Candidatus Neomarinimicrobiota bacterium]
MLKIYYRKSLRLKNWDYGWNGIYYVTIQTNCSFSIFGEINNGKMILSKFGKIADRYWRDIPNRFSHVRLDEYVIMPDHIHGIVIIDKNKSSDAINRVTTQNINNCHIGGITGNNNPMLYQNLSRIIRWYKGRVTFEIR